VVIFRDRQVCQLLCVKCALRVCCVSALPVVVLCKVQSAPNTRIPRGHLSDTGVILQHLYAAYTTEMPPRAPNIWENLRGSVDRTAPDSFGTLELFKLYARPIPSITDSRAGFGCFGLVSLDPVYGY